MIDRDALRVAALTTFVSRAGAWAVALAAHAVWGQDVLNATQFDLPAITQPFGSRALNSAGGVLAHWDAVWYLLIANNGYAGAHGLPAALGSGQWHSSINFFPGYPLLVRLVSGFGSASAVEVAAYATSLISFAVALYLLNSLARIEVGISAANWSVVLLAAFPGALFFGIPYAESLFLALTVGSFYAARTGRWRIACALGGAAALTRPPGVILLFPLALFYLRQRTRGCGRRLSWDALWLLLVPAGLGTFLAYCARLTGDPWAYFHVGRVFGRGISDPISATVRAFGAASDGLAGIIRTVGGSGGYSSFWIADLAGLIVLVAAVAVLVGALRNLPLPYGVYCLASLIVILCTGPVRHPLVPATRYVAVLFPLFIELGRAAGARRNLGAAITVALALVLVVATGAYAHWVFLG